MDLTRSDKLRYELSILRNHARTLNENRARQRLIAEAIGLYGDFISFNRNKQIECITSNIVKIDNYFEEKECEICYCVKKMGEFKKLNCNHLFCANCVNNSIKNDIRYSGPACPMCRETISSLVVFED
jgi:hypothetical protein